MFFATKTPRRKDSQRAQVQYITLGVTLCLSALVANKRLFGAETNY